MAEPQIPESFEPPEEPVLMRRLAIGATAYLWGSNALYLLTRGRFVSPDKWETLYLIILGAYAGGAEFKQWTRGTESGDSWQAKARKGGPLITAWVLLLLAAAIARQADATIPMPPELEPITTKVIALFFGTYAFRQFRRARPLGRKADGSVDDSILAQRVLERLTQAPARSSELSQSLQIAPRTLSRLLKSLLDEGHITRESRSPTDPTAVYKLKR